MDGRACQQNWFCCVCWAHWDAATGRRWAVPSDLDALFRLYGTDKSSVVHGYAKVYEVLFAPLRFSLRLLLEVGVGTVNPNGSSSMHYLIRDSVAPQYKPGASARAWRDYFPHASAVVSVDVDPETMIVGEDRICTHVADSTQPEAQQLLARVYGEGMFDVIIDDGVHTAAAQQQTLSNFWSLVRPGGIYVIEDVQWHQGDSHEFIHGSSVDLKVAEILSEGAPFLAMASIGQPKWGKLSHNSNLLVLRKPEDPPSLVD